MTNNKRPELPHIGAETLRKAIEDATFGTRALQEFSAQSRVAQLAAGLSPEWTATSLLSRNLVDPVGATTLRAISEGLFGPASTFSALSEAVEQLQRPYRNIGLAMAEAAQSVKPSIGEFQSWAVPSAYSLGDLATTQGYQTSLLQLSNAVTRMLEAVRPDLAFRSDWDQSILSRLELFKPSWSLVDTDVAVFEFGRLSRLSDTVHGPDPYSPTVAEYVEEELEDSGSDGSLEGNGFDIFADDAMSTVIVTAGFQFRLPRTPVPLLEGGATFDGVYDPGHHAILVDLEQRLRRLIVQQLTLYDGTDWKRKVPAELIEKWSSKQEAQRAQGNPVFELIDYSDFGELADIIVSRGNWNNAFAQVFKNKTEVEVSMRRLQPLRNDVAHARPLSKLQAIWLVTEATRLHVQLGTPAVDLLR